MLATGGATVASPVASSSGGRQQPSAKTTPNTGKKSSPSVAVDSPATSATPVTPAATKTSMVGSHRPPNTEDPLLISIAANQGTLVQQLITMTCYTPTKSVGAVIGRRGATIAQIQKQAQHVGTSNGAVRLSIVGQHLLQQQGGAGDMHPAGATTGASPGAGEMQQQQLLHGQITQAAPQSPNPSQVEQSHLNQAQQQQQLLMTPLQQQHSGAASVPYTYTELDLSSPLWTPIVIRADPCAALTAAKLLRDKVGQMDDIVMDIPLGRAKHAAVVGRRGYVLANLSADTNVRIMVPRRELRHDIIQLEGQLDKVKQCFERVLSIANDAAGSSNNNNSSNNATNSNKKNKGGKNSSSDKNCDDNTSIVIKLSVLPSQTKLRTIGRKSDTIIKKKKADDNCWDLTVTGSSPENVQSAVAILKKWSEDNANKDANNSKAEGNDASNSSSNNNNNTTSGGNSTPNNKSRGRGRHQKRGGPKRNRNNNNGGKNTDSPAT